MNIIINTHESLVSNIQELKFFPFTQNNSGANYEINEPVGISQKIYIQATNAELANKKAESIGVYFDGVNLDIDCECCGNRWTETTDYDQMNNEELQEDIDRSIKFMRMIGEDATNSVFIHKIDGTIINPLN